MDAISDFLNKDLIAGNAVKDILLFIGALALTIGLASMVQKLFRTTLSKLAERSKTHLDDIILQTFEKPIYWVILAGGVGISLDMLVLPGGLVTFIDNVTTILIMIFIAWSASNFITAFRSTYIEKLVGSTETKLDDQIIPIVEKTLKVTIWFFAVLIAADNVGFDIVSLLTGLGIGGLALAMAAKDTLSNVFGSVTIFADRPFSVGDVVSLQGHLGTITEIGLRTFRLKTLDDSIVTVPNALLVGGVSENHSLREARKHVATVGLVYETTSAQLDAAIAATKEILAENEKIRDDYAVRFMNFGDSALEITMVYWVTPQSEYFDVVSDVNLAIKRRYDAEGWSMAFPSMTIYKGD